MEKTVAIKFGETIRKVRGEHRMSQEELAEQCGLHRTYISDVELGKRNVSLENISRLTKALSVSISDLFKEMGE